jgi:hypothetical protein
VEEWLHLYLISEERIFFKWGQIGNAYKIFVERRDDVGDQPINWMIILSIILKNWDVKVWIGVIWLRIGSSSRLG